MGHRQFCAGSLQGCPCASYPHAREHLDTRARYARARARLESCYTPESVCASGGRGKEQRPGSRDVLTKINSRD